MSETELKLKVSGLLAREGESMEKEAFHFGWLQCDGALDDLQHSKALWSVARNEQLAIVLLHVVSSRQFANSYGINHEGIIFSCENEERMEKSVCKVRLPAPMES